MSSVSEYTIRYRPYVHSDLNTVIDLVHTELSEPYVVYTYRYFLDQWPHLCLIAQAVPRILGNTTSRSIGVIVCKQSQHKSGAQRGYIAMLSVSRDFRKRGIARRLVQRAIRTMRVEGATEVVLETEYDNAAALSLYESLGFIREKRLYRFYLNGKDAFRLVLPVLPLQPGDEMESDEDEELVDVLSGTRTRKTEQLAIQQSDHHRFEDDGVDGAKDDAEDDEVHTDEDLGDSSDYTTDTDREYTTETETETETETDTADEIPRYRPTSHGSRYPLSDLASDSESDVPPTNSALGVPRYLLARTGPRTASTNSTVTSSGSLPTPTLAPGPLPGSTGGFGANPRAPWNQSPPREHLHTIPMLHHHAYAYPPLAPTPYADEDSPPPQMII
ncbi:acyl-CoA N-acyltransferase [Auriculariales sp. MPI-PUGE-AT-0066]|nr:acyl-CoA N-acyltransferase [Auriculariales sp. MPI-PUGE-AT-0066]